jgi:tRNA modification GTPase
MRNGDTIFAVASGSGKAAVKIVRVSGRRTGAVIDALALGPLQPRVATLRKILHPGSHALIDSGLALWFPGPASFTGEDSLELHIHGGRAVEQALLRALADVSDCRMAEAGEFAWRAFSNGKLDLTAVEGLADLIDADTELQRQQALEQTNGKLARAAKGWRRALVDCLSLIEAEIDFEDEADAPKRTAPAVVDKVAGVLDELRNAIQDFARAEVTRDGFCVIILGPPNVGKSSLLNCLLSRDAAIVDASPGTTRDLIEATLDLNGAPVVFVDTAGLRPSDDPVEMIGIERARVRAAKAQLVLWMAIDPDLDPPPKIDAPIVCLRAKADLSARHSDFLAVSALSGQGIDDLLSFVGERARSHLRPESPALLTRNRHYSAVRLASQSLQAMLNASGFDLELAAEDLRQAAWRLESLMGRIDSEDVLGDIFSRFCIGK